MSWISHTGKVKVYLTAIMSSALSILITLLVCYDSKYIWAHRAFIASEAKHDDYPDAEYSKTFIAGIDISMEIHVKQDNVRSEVRKSAREFLRRRNQLNLCEMHRQEQPKCRPDATVVIDYQYFALH